MRVFRVVIVVRAGACLGPDVRRLAVRALRCTGSCAPSGTTSPTSSPSAARSDSPLCPLSNPPHPERAPPPHPMTPNLLPSTLHPFLSFDLLPPPFLPSLNPFSLLELFSTPSFFRSPS
eukprot:1633399-Rhodomonas_salina.3